MVLILIFGEVLGLYGYVGGDTFGYIIFMLTFDGNKAYRWIDIEHEYRLTN